MSILYSLVSRSYDVVLTEHTEFAGNFQQISRLLMRKMLKEGKHSISYDKHKFHYHYENNMIYLCMTEGNITEEIVFSFLKDVRKTFNKTYKLSQIQKSHAYQLTEFNDVLQKLIVLNDNFQQYYNNNPEFDKEGEVIFEKNYIKDVSKDNVEKWFDRDEKLNIVAMKSDYLREKSINVNINVLVIIIQIQAATHKIKEKNRIHKYLIFSALVFVFNN